MNLKNMKSNTKIKTVSLNDIEVGHMIYVHANGSCITNYITHEKNVSTEIALVTNVDRTEKSFSAITINDKVGVWLEPGNSICISDEPHQILNQRKKLLKLYSVTPTPEIHKLLWQQERLTAAQMRDCNTLWKAT